MSEQKTILVVDDEADLVAMMKSILEGKGFRVLTACNGEEGLKQLEQTSPHLIVLDMNMPKVSGIDFYQQIYNPYTGKAKFPVLVLTARANLQVLFRDLNVDGFMTKPFEIDRFLDEVGLILEKRYGERGSFARKANAGPKKVLIVEDDPAVFDKFVIGFINAGYSVTAAKTGSVAFDRVVADQPDLILIKLGLLDLPGDILATKLKHMPKTMDIPLILYTQKDGRLDSAVTNQLCRKIGIKELVETNDPHVLLKESEHIFAAA